MKRGMEQVLEQATLLLKVISRVCIMINKIEHNNKVVALLIDHSNTEEGTHPITDPRGALQLLMMKRKAGHSFDKHTHEIMERSSSELQEAIIVTKGKLRINLCDREGKDITSVEVSSGQCIFFITGGFGIDVLEDAEFFEFKNGPHTEDKILL